MVQPLLKDHSAVMETMPVVVAVASVVGEAVSAEAEEDMEDLKDLALREEIPSMREVVIVKTVHALDMIEVPSPLE